MPDHYVTTVQGLVLAAQGESVFVSPSGVLTEGIELRGTGSQYALINGTLFGPVQDITTATSGGSSVVVGSTGAILRDWYTGIYLTGGGNTVINHGQITTAVSGGAIDIRGDRGGHANERTTVINTGLISSSFNATDAPNRSVVQVWNAYFADITNTGSILGSASARAAILVADWTNGALLTNTGTVRGNVQFYCPGTVTVLNTGLIDGTLQTSTGSDAIDTRGGHVHGWIRTDAGSDTVQGGAGADSIDGGLGADSMAGGAGDDTYVIDRLDDELVEFAGDGRDTVVVSFSYVLDEFFENATAGGTSALNLTGNAERNVLRGNAGANMLNGAAGVDTMIGGAGSDTYVVDAAYERTVEKAGEGLDTVYSSISWTLADAVEVLRLTGTATFGNGNALANTILGNAAGNALQGLAGNDTIGGAAGNDLISGGLGADLLTGGAGLDSFLFDTAPGTPGNADVITDFTPVDDTIRLENAVFAGLPVAGFLAAAAFRSGAGVTAAGDADDRIVYDTASGKIYYDSDGIGGAPSVLVATLATKPVLSAADFLVV